MVHSWAREAQPEEGFLQIDFSNAFNCISRSSLLQQVSLHAPAFFPYSLFSYSTPTPLFGTGFTLSSHSGVQQGDACGPLLFSLVLHRLMPSLSSLGLQGMRWYLDDGILYGSMSQLDAALRILQSEGDALGLHLNLRKCCLWAPQPPPTSADMLRQVTPVPWDQGITLLGCPVGSDSYVRSHLQVQFAKVEGALDRLGELGCPHSALLILRSCLGACKVIHLFRCLPISHALWLAGQMRSSVAHHLSLLLGCSLPPESFTLACLPASCGGLGFLDPSECVLPASLSLSSLLSFHYTQSFSDHHLFGSQWLQPFFPMLSLCSGNGLQAWLSSPKSHSFSPDWCVQRWWSQCTLEQRVAQFESSAPVRLGALRRLFSAPHSGECLSVCTDPSHNRLLAPPEAQLFFRWRLGLPLSANPPQLCLACQCPQDPFGDHTLCCSACGIYGRHNFVRDALGEELQDSGFKVSREVPIPSGGGRRPADLLIEALESEPLAADIGLVHPLLLNNSLAGVFAGTASAPVLRWLNQQTFVGRAAGGLFRSSWRPQGRGRRALIRSFAVGRRRSA